MSIMGQRGSILKNASGYPKLTEVQQAEVERQWVAAGYLQDSLVMDDAEAAKLWRLMQLTELHYRLEHNLLSQG
jgi:hypothetical protein